MYHAPVRTRIPLAVHRSMPRTATYLGEDATYYYWMNPAATDQLGGFFDNIGNMFTRMVKFTPKSFTPGNIYKGFVNTTLTVASGGAYQLLPKNLKKTVYEVGKVAIPVIAGGALAAIAGPAVMATLMPKLTAAAKIMGGVASGTGSSGVTSQDYGSLLTSSAAPRPGVDILGGAERVLTIGGELMNLLGRLPQNKQAEVIDRLTPEDIAYMERTQQVPPHLKGYFDSMAQQTFNPPLASSGAAGLYGAPYAPSEPVPESSGFMGMDMSTLVLIAGAGVLGVVLMTGGRR